ncbi:MAG: hypothetical protein KF798_02475 [Candidatus Paracaedibacteraceae bacterium]|nr:hypothetical protein [Candidatus Paracaedibacteraceae bacterium]
MKSRFLKILSIIMCSLVMILCSEVQSTQPDIKLERSGLQGTRLVAQTEVDLTSSQTIELEKPSTSWASYLVTPLKAVSDLMRYAAQNPTKTAMISLVLVANITAVAATCNCYCRDFGSGYPQFVIRTRNTFECMDVCYGEDLDMNTLSIFRFHDPKSFHSCPPSRYR